MVEGWEEVIFEIGERGLMGVPCFVIAEVDLDHADAGGDETAGGEERPAEAVAAVAVEEVGRGFGDVECVVDAGIGEEGDGGGAVLVELGVVGGGFEGAGLGFEGMAEGDAVHEAVEREPLGEGEFGRVEGEGGVRDAAFFVMEEEVRKCAVVGWVVGRHFEEPRVVARAEEGGVLAGDGAAGIVDDAVWEDDGRGEAVRGRDESGGEGGDGRPVGGVGSGGVEAGGEVRPAGEHDVVSGGVVVGGVGERADEGPEVRAGGEGGEVLADVDARGAGGDGAEFAADVSRGVGFHVEGFLLGETAGEEDEDDGFGVSGGGWGGEEVIEGEAEAGEGAGGDGVAAGDGVARVGAGAAGREAAHGGRGRSG